MEGTSVHNNFRKGPVMLSRADLAAFRKNLLALANRAEEVRTELVTEADQKEGSSPFKAL